MHERVATVVGNVSNCYNDIQNNCTILHQDNFVRHQRFEMLFNVGLVKVLQIKEGSFELELQLPW